MSTSTSTSTSTRRNPYQDVKCFECGRWFNLADERDAGEWAHGHDCEETA